MVEDENNFDKAEEALTDGLKEGFLELHTDGLQLLDENMREGKDALGRPWTPIKPETLEARKVRTQDASPLVDTSNLRADIQATSTIDLDKLIAYFASSSVYAPPHEFGWPEAGIPRRPFIAPAGTWAERNSEEYIGREIDVRMEDAEVD